VDITNPISVEGESLSLARITISTNSDLAGKTVGQVEDGYSCNIVLVRHDHTSDLHPTDSMVLESGNLLAVLGRPEKLNALVHASQ
jgi:Trk K+ transport system NAD-binding subunit